MALNVGNVVPCAAPASPTSQVSSPRLNRRADAIAARSATGLSGGYLERASVFGSVGRTMREKYASISDRLSGQNERDPSGVAADGVFELAVGIFSAGVANSAAGIVSNGTVGLAAVVLSLFIVSFPVGGVLPAGGAGVSTLPRMIGKPSLPLPMTTTFEFVDCES
jgi:hypothetical protein